VLAAEAAERKVAEREGKASEVGAAKAERARIKALKEAEKARQEASKAEKAAASKAAKAAEKERKEEERAAEKVKREAEKAAAAVAREAKKEADKAAKEAKALENQFALPAGWTESKVAKKDKAGKPTAATATVYLSPTGARVSSKAAVLKMAESEAKKAKTQKRMGAFMMGFLKGAPSPTAVAKKAAVGLEKDAAARQAAAVAAPEEEAAEQPEEATGPAATEPAVESEGADANMEEKQAPAEETQEAWMTRWVADGVEVCKEVFPDWEAQATAIIAMDDAEVQSGIDGMGEALESAEQAAMHPALEYVVRYSREVLARR
jgi:colicin import membrane protein